jgi:hypothetical protein
MLYFYLVFIISTDHRRRIFKDKYSSESNCTVSHGEGLGLPNSDAQQNQSICRRRLRKLSIRSYRHLDVLLPGQTNYISIRDLSTPERLCIAATAVSANFSLNDFFTQLLMTLFKSFSVAKSFGLHSRASHELRFIFSGKAWHYVGAKKSTV